ncbi:ABC transporter permease [Williamsoniiplasma somnilux]|uniref:ABC transporter permease n=1 Tax=Williamsoniiplasma somnilux TaxID=215578 RepID=A0A2K8NZW3_9MOLU|nr:ABC transporter permease [Williamsoniiplasma somnilux]ATZ19086.1 ABC transporter permease [Williamsoniiplasma somnilux]
MKSNRILMLKQGIKGVFKFKIQFSIILILTFLASLILTVSISTNRRLQHEYNDVVKVTQKFDNTWSLNTGKNISASDERKFIPILDTISPLNSYIKANGKSDYNVVLNQSAANGSVNNYITRTTNTEPFKEAYTNLFKNFNSQEFNLKADRESYNKSFFQEKLAMTNLLATQFYKDLIKLQNNSQDSDIAYLLDTPFGNYTLLNKDWFAKYIDIANLESKNLDYKTIYENILKNYANDENAQLVMYSFFAIQSLSERIAYVTFDGWYNNQQNQQIDVAWFYNYVFGIKYDNLNESKGYYSIFPDKVSLEEINTKKDDYVLLGSTNIKTLADQLSKEGWRGNTNLVLTNATYNDSTISAISWDPRNFFSGAYNELATFATTNYMWSTEFSGNMEKYFSIFQEKNDWMDPNASLSDFFFADIEAKDGLQHTQKRAAAFLAHETLATKAAGYETYVRREILYNDATTQKKYRAIALQSDQLTKFKILKGVMPSGLGDIAISQQFAKKNKVKIGDNIKIGNGLFYITAFAVDTYSFYPSADPLVPLPKGETDGLIYASPQTLKLLTQPSIQEATISGDVTQTYNFINISNIDPNDQASLNEQRNRYIIFNNASKSNSEANALLLKDQQEIKKAVLAKGFFDLKDFKASTYHFNWTLYPLVFKIYSWITYLTSGLIGIIELASLFVCVRKTIQANSKQIGILKALGVEPKQISFSYISYAFFIGFLAVPLGWLAGTLLQIPMANIFANYFSFSRDNLFFDWMAPLIAFVGFGFVSAILGFFTAYVQTNKPVLEITLNKTRWVTSPTIDFVKRTIFKKAPFHTRLSLQLASSGRHVITLLVVCVFASSLLISTGFAIPAVAINAKQTYFKNTKFRNSAVMHNPTGNSPFSKDGVTFWNGHEELDKDYVINDPIKLDGISNSGYYNNPNNYVASLNNSGIFPSLQYTKTNNGIEDINTIFENVARGRTKITNAFLSASGNSLAMAQGVGFSIGVIEQFYALVLNTKNLKDYHGNILIDENTSDAQRIAKAAALSGAVTQALPQVLDALIDNWQNNTSADATWKDKLMGMMTAFAPSFIKAYLTNKSRDEQFALGFGTSNYVPKKETFATTFKAQTDNHKEVTFTGLDASQDAYKINESLKNKIFFDSQKGRIVKAQIEQILNNTYKENHDILFNGFKVWDNTTKTLTIPVANNKQANAYYGMEDGDIHSNINVNSQALELYSPIQGNNVKLPMYAFAYNDTDYIESAKSWSSSENMHQGERTLLNPYGYAEKTENGNYYLDAHTIQNSKMTYNLQFEPKDPTTITQTDYSSDTSPELAGKFNVDKWTGLQDKAYMFGDFKYDENGNIINSFIRPYYQYKNVELFIPASFALSPNDVSNLELGPVDDTLENGSNNKKYQAPVAKFLTDTLGNQSEQLGLKWFLKQNARVVSDSNVPDFVKESWTGQKDSYKNDKYIVVNAYDSRFSTYLQGDQGDNSVPPISDGKQSGSELSALTNGYLPWMLNAVAGQTIKTSGSSPVSKGLAKTINLKSVGTIKTYDSSLVVLDSDIANILNGWPTVRTTSYDYRAFNEQSRDKDPESRFYKYDLVDFTKLKSSSDWQSTSFVKSQDSQGYNPHAFYNTILSNFNEPIAVTSAASMIDDMGKFGITAIKGYPDSSGIHTYGVSGFNFLSEKVALLNQITSVAIWIAILVVTAVVIASALLIMLLGDIYIAQYKRFIIMLRSFGYSNRSIMSYVLGTVTGMSIIAWGIATGLTWGGIYLAISLIAKAGLAIPFGVLWWAPVACIAIMLVSYLGSLFVSSKSARKEAVASMMSATSE